MIFGPRTCWRTAAKMDTCSNYSPARLTSGTPSFTNSSSAAAPGIWQRQHPYLV
jgi:cobalamin biosynthesis protein CobD/CbiB